MENVTDSGSIPTTEPGDQATVFEYDGNEEGLAVEIVEAIADILGTDSLDLEPTLYDVIDPEALETCVRSGNDDLTISFTVYGCRVVITGDGVFTVSEAE